MLSPQSSFILGRRVFYIFKSAEVSRDLKECWNNWDRHLNVDNLVPCGEGCAQHSRGSLNAHTYCRSTRRPPPSCQSFHLDSILGAQSERSGLSLSAVTCGASRCQRSCFLQKSAERKGGSVRSMILMHLLPIPELKEHRCKSTYGTPRRSSSSHICQIESDSHKNSEFRERSFSRNNVRL